MSVIAAKFLVFLSTLLPSQSAFVLEGSKTSYAQFRKWDGGGGQNYSGLGLEFRSDGHTGLLLYTDHPHSCQFIELKLVEGRVRLRFDLGSGSQVISTNADLNYSDNRWHKVRVERQGDNTTLVVDDFKETVVCTPAHSQEQPWTNQSYLYVGGLPSWFSADLKDISVPSVVFEPKYRGSIRNVVYIDSSGLPRRQEIQAFKGVRASNVDACQLESPCKNGGSCVPTDQGPVCLCDRTGYTGIYCEQEQKVPEATFTGNNGIKYNLADLKGQPILAKKDRIKLYFKTKKSSALLFYNGHESDFLLISLKNGGVSLTINLHSGQLETAIKPDGVFFNDNVWHEVVLSREIQQSEEGVHVCKVTLWVDGKYPERWNPVVKQEYLYSSTVLVGGSEGIGESELLLSTNNLIGCIKQVEYDADSIHLDLLALAKDRHPLISKFGKTTFVCQEFGVLPPQKYKSENRYMAWNYEHDRVISFTNPQSFLMLPSWETSTTGSIQFKIRTTEPDGILVYNGPREGESDFFALELIEGFLYIHLNLGSGPVKIKASRSSRHLADGEWHKVELTINRNHGRIAIDGATEDFTTPSQSEQLDLDGSLYLGGLDHLAPGSTYPPALWSASLRNGFVGCLKDLSINGANIDITGYAHRQDSGSIRSSCHEMPGRCHDRPCLHGGSCREGWNRYICDCSTTSFTGPTCSRGASTVHFDGSNYISIERTEEVTEAQDLTLKFRTRESTGLLFLAKSQLKQDTIEIQLEDGRVKILVQIGAYDKTFYLGQAVNDDFWHTVRFQRRGRLMEGRLDEEESEKSEAFGAETTMSLDVYHIGGVNPRLQSGSSGPNFVGRIQQLQLNKERLLDEAHLQQIQYEGNVKFQHAEDSTYNAVSFSSHHTYLGMPQLKTYNNIDIYFQFKTLEKDGLILFNSGKQADFIAVELVNGHIHYTFNMGYGVVTLKDNADTSLADNKYHSVWIRRTTRFQQIVVIDNYHKVASNGLGENYQLNLDGILHLGGVNPSTWQKLPPEITSKYGFQGCLASLEINDESLDPNKDALVPSPAVTQGCQESVAYEFTGTGIITYMYPDNKLPDTKADTLTMAFITLMSRAVLFRVNSAKSNDFMELRLEDGHVVLEYNLGTESITVKDSSRTFNDGTYHTVRFSRTGPNSTLQVDDSSAVQRYPDGRHLTVFNYQSLVQIGGRWLESRQSIHWPFQGVIAGLVYNTLRPLDIAADRGEGARIKGSVTMLTSIPYDYKVKPPVQEPAVSWAGQLTISPEGSGDGNFDSGDLATAPGRGEDSMDHPYQHQLGPGIHFVGGGFMPCEDDEDICDFGSGAGGTGGSNSVGGGSLGRSFENSMYSPVNDVKNSQTETTTETSISTTTPATTQDHPSFPVTESADSHADRWSVLSIDPDDPEDHQDEETTQHSVKCYDDKYNVPCDEVTLPPTSPTPRKDNRGMSGTMSLVIGIILGSFIAMILIVIIVLKVRTGVDMTDCKQEEMRKYQFTSPNVTDKVHPTTSCSDRGPGAGAVPGPQLASRGPLGVGGGPPPQSQQPPPHYQQDSDQEFNNDTATTSLINNTNVKSGHHLGRSSFGSHFGMGLHGASSGGGGGHGGHSGGHSSGGGFFNGSLSTAINGERARLFKKANSYGRPVREWYV